jgi:hypothetical protein
MHYFTKWALWLTVAGATMGISAGQPALTTIQDILYRADGTRFTGTMFIHWNSFQSGDTANIATASLTLPIVNGVLNTRLVPTTTATAGAQYNVVYNSGGRTQFTETWAVPPSSLKLKVRDVRLSSGTVVGPAPVISPVQIGDVIGLSNALSVRPTEGVGFAIGRAAVINQAGQLDAAAGNLGDCVRVDGSAGPCGGSGGSLLPEFADSEAPAGAVDGSNATFTLAAAPSPVNSLNLYRNGVLLKQGLDYTAFGNAISFYLGAIPQSGDTLAASYRFANPNNPLGSLTSSQVICSSVGTSSSAAVLSQLGSCTIPAGLLGTGDRIEVSFRFSHTGTATGFTGDIRWGNTTLLSRSGANSEPALTGKLSIGIFAGGQSWDAQSWGTSLAMATGAGSATENSTASITVSLRGQTTAITGDTLTLRNFSVVRYPAQTNP